MSEARKTWPPKQTDEIIYALISYSPNYSKATHMVDGFIF
jgi:hypothetical protein